MKQVLSSENEPAVIVKVPEDNKQGGTNRKGSFEVDEENKEQIVNVYLAPSDPLNAGETIKDVYSVNTVCTAEQASAALKITTETQLINAIEVNSNSNLSSRPLATAKMSEQDKNTIQQQQPNKPEMEPKESELTVVIPENGPISNLLVMEMFQKVSRQIGSVKTDLTREIQDIKDAKKEDDGKFIKMQEEVDANARAAEQVQCQNELLQNKNGTDGRRNGSTATGDR